MDSPLWCGGALLLDWFHTLVVSLLVVRADRVCMAGLCCCRHASCLLFVVELNFAPGCSSEHLRLSDSLSQPLGSFVSAPAQSAALLLKPRHPPKRTDFSPQCNWRLVSFKPTTCQRMAMWRDEVSMLWQCRPSGKQLFWGEARFDPRGRWVVRK